MPLKNITGLDISKLAAEYDLFSLITEIDKIDVDKLKTVPVHLSYVVHLGTAVYNDVAKKTAYDKLAAKVNNIGTSGIVLKTKYTADKSDLEKKISYADKNIPDTSTSRLVKKTYYNAKIGEVESKIPSINGSATNSALTAVENKIPDVSSLV